VNTQTDGASNYVTFQKILVVIDPAATTHPCLDKAVRLATGFGSTLELFICDDEPRVPETWAEEHHAQLRRRRVSMLEALASPLRAGGLRVEVDSEWHVPRDEGIVTRAIRSGVDLVVKDTLRHHAASNMPMDQTDSMLIRQLPMPLLLVRPAPWRAHALIAASVDPCHVADRPAQLDRSLARLAAAMGEMLAGEAVLLHVTEPTPRLAGDAVTRAERVADMSRHHEAVSTLANGLGVGVDDSGFVEEHVPEGIVQLVGRKQPAILLMGASARARPEVSDINTACQVLERTECDLLVVKPQGFVSPGLVTRA
jgi:universal stress protein E